jgi:hypothetical protein
MQGRATPLRPPPVLVSEPRGPMHPFSLIHFLVTSVVAGALGAIALEVAMWLICRTGWAKGNMIVAVGAILTRSRETAFQAGVLLHSISAVVFAMIYAFAMMQMGLTQLPTAFFIGIGFGMFHGLVVSLMLVWIVAERHPLEEFQEAGLAVGLSHFVGHVAYGAIVGLVIGLLGL